MKRKPKSRRVNSPTRAAIARLDRAFSKFIRLRDSDENGTGNCCTCGKPLHYKDGHACHFVSRRHMAARWREDNVHLGCPRCNTFLDGALDEYSRFIISRYGMDRFNELLSLKNETKRWLPYELQDLILKYEQEVKTREARLSLQG